MVSGNEVKGRDKKNGFEFQFMARSKDVGILLFIIGFGFILQPANPILLPFLGLANSTLGAIIIIVGLYIFAK